MKALARGEVWGPVAAFCAAVNLDAKERERVRTCWRG